MSEFVDQVLFSSKGFNGDHRNSATVLDTRNTFSFSQPELSVSVTLSPLCSMLNYASAIITAAVISVSVQPWA